MPAIELLTPLSPSENMFSGRGRKGTSTPLHVVTKSRLEEYARMHGDARTSLLTWWKTADMAGWRHIQDVRQTYRHADFDPGTQLTIFNIMGNRYRLRVRIDYDRRMIFIHNFMTHAQYTRPNPERDRPMRPVHDGPMDHDLLAREEPHSIKGEEDAADRSLSGN